MFVLVCIYIAYYIILTYFCPVHSLVMTVNHFSLERIPRLNVDVTSETVQHVSDR